MKLEIPDNNDPVLIKAIEELTKKPSNHIIAEIYGKPTKNQFMGSGRTNIFFDDMSQKNLTKRVHVFKRLHIDYNYALNGIIPRTRILENRNKIIEELKWLERSPIKIITITNYELAKLAKKYCPGVKIVVSFFAGVDNKEKIRQWAKIPNIKTIITASSTYRNVKLLKELVDFAEGYGIEIGIIANLGCMGNCARKEEHAIIKDMASIDSSSLHYAPCTFYCMKYLLENPEKFLQLPLVRPEDLKIYEKAGVKLVKLVDRSQTTQWIKKIVGYYLAGSYQGNILDLTCNYTTLNLKKHSNAQVAKIRISKIIKSKKAVLDYREKLPELLDIKIDHSYNLLACNNICDNCSGCQNVFGVKYNKERRKIVLGQLDKLESEYLFS